MIDEDIEQNDEDDTIADDASLSSDDECLAAKKMRRNQESFQSSEINTGKIRKFAKKKHEKKKAKKISENDETDSEKYIIAKLQNMNADLNTIYKNWEKTSLTDLPAISLAKDDSTTKRSMAKKKMIDKEDVKGQNVKKDVVAKIASLSSDLDSIRENCAKLINYKEGLMNPKERFVCMYGQLYI